MPLDKIVLIIIAAAVVILVIAVVILVVKLCKTLNTVQKKLEDMGDGPKELIHNVSSISEDLNQKLKFFNPLFRAIGNLGEGLEYKSLSFKDRHFWKSFKDKLDAGEEEEVQGDKLDDIVDLAVSGFNLWKKLKR